MKTRTAIKLIAVGLVLLVAGVAVKVFERHTDPERLRRRLESGLAQALDAEVRVGAVRLELIGGTVRVRNLSVATYGDETPVLECPRLTVRLDRGALLRGRVVPITAVLAEPALWLTYDREARRWNLADLHPRRGRMAGDGPAGDLLTDGLYIENGAVWLRHARLFGDARPRRYPGLRVSLRPEAGGTGRWQFEGALEAGHLAGARFEGWARPGGEPAFALTVHADGLTSGEEFWESVPMGHRIWRDYRPVGRLAVEGSVRPGEGGRVRYGLDVHVSDATAKTKFFPAEAHSVNGKVRVSDATLTIEDVTGVIAPEEFGEVGPQARPAQLRVNGVCRWDRRGGEYTIEALDVPLCRASVEGMPKAGKELWRRLKPGGRTHLLLRLQEMAQRGGLRFRAEAELQEATLAPAELPVPLRRVHGMVQVDEREVRFRDLRGLLAGDGSEAAGEFALDGVLDLARRDSRLSLELHGVRTSEALVKAVPGLGEELWRLLRPAVLMDARLVLTDVAGSGGMAHAAEVHLRGGQAEPSFMPLPMSDMTGRLRVEGSRIFIDHFTAAVETAGEQTRDGRTRSRVDLRGKVDLEAKRTELDVLARDLTLTQNLLQAVPQVGPQILAQAAASGMVSLSGRIRHDARAERPLRYFLDISLRDVTVQPRLLPMPVEALSGDLLATEHRALSSNLTGVSCGGQVHGSIVGYYGGVDESPSYGATVHFDQISLADLADRLSDEDREVSGRLSGTLNLGGILGDAASLNGYGRLELSKAQLWQSPFFARLISILHLTIPSDRPVPAAGDAVFDLRGPKAMVREFNLTGGGLSLSGFGTVWLSDGTLDLKMVAVGTPEGAPAVPILGDLVGAVLQAVEKELVWLDVTGSIGDPVFEHRVLSKLTRPITSLRGILFSPLFGAESAPPREQ